MAIFESNVATDVEHHLENKTPIYQLLCCRIALPLTTPIGNFVISRMDHKLSTGYPGHAPSNTHGK